MGCRHPRGSRLGTGPPSQGAAHGGFPSMRPHARTSGTPAPMPERCMSSLQARQGEGMLSPTVSCLGGLQGGTHSLHSECATVVGTCLWGLLVVCRRKHEGPHLANKDGIHRPIGEGQLLSSALHDGHARDCPAEPTDHCLVWLHRRHLQLGLLHKEPVSNHTPPVSCLCMCCA